MTTGVVKHLVGSQGYGFISNSFGLFWETTDYS